MIFLASIGNTNLTYGLFHQGIITVDRYPIQKLSDPSDIESLYNSILIKHEISKTQIEGAVLTSVVPEKNNLFMETLGKLTSSEPIFISAQTDFGLDRSEYSGVLGTDRLLCCSAALKKYKSPFIVIDLGTATTLNVINQHGAFIGGVILPGVVTGLQALATKTSLLQSISFTHQDSVIGKNTAEGMLAGATYGNAAMIEGLVKRIQQELGDITPVIVTGGNVDKVLAYCDMEVNVEPNLLLEGLAEQYIRHNIVHLNKEVSHEY